MFNFVTDSVSTYESTDGKPTLKKIKLDEGMNSTVHNVFIVLLFSCTFVASIYGYNSK